MIASAHVAAGFVAGMLSARLTRNRPARIAIALVLGVLSHVGLDAIPHADYGTMDRHKVAFIAAAEIAVTCLLALLLLRRRLPEHWPEVLIAGILGAVIPDVKFMAGVLLPGPAPHVVQRYGDRFHSYFHAAPSRYSVGMRNQIVAAVLLLASLVSFRRRPLPER